MVHYLRNALILSLFWCVPAAAQTAGYWSVGDVTCPIHEIQHTVLVQEGVGIVELLNPDDNERTRLCSWRVTTTPSLTPIDAQLTHSSSSCTWAVMLTARVPLTSMPIVEQRLSLYVPKGHLTCLRLSGRTNVSIDIGYILERVE